MQKKNERKLHIGRWLVLKESVYETDDGGQVRWESIDRRHSREVVVIVACLKPSNRIVLIRQFRPAVNNHVIGFPAGIIEDDNVEGAVHRELREETGYVGTVRHLGPRLLSNSALLSDHVRLAYVDIDEDAVVNRTPVQSLEPTEEIEVLLVDRVDMRRFMLERKGLGDDIGSGPWYLFGFWESVPAGGVGGQ